MSNNVNFLKIFNGNMSTALRQSATLAKPKNWKERFNNRTALGKTLSFARYGAVVAIAGLATDSFLENDITSNNAAA